MRSTDNGTSTQGPGRRIEYLVSRFPITTETFILRELDALEDATGAEVGLSALLPAREQILHESASRRAARGVTRTRPMRGLARLTRFLVVSPRRGFSMVGEIVRRHRRHPRGAAKALWVVVLAADLAADLRRRDVDHLHAHFAGNPGMAAWAVHRMTGLPYSVTTHAYDLYRSDQLFLEPVVTEASRVVTISEYNQRFLCAVGVDSSALSVIRCGLPLERYRYRPRIPPETGDIRILCVASLQEYKGHRHLLDALSHDGMDRVVLDLVGAGPLEEALREQARSLRPSAVRFHGSQPEEAVAQILDEAHIFVLPSVIGSDGRMEGVPVALMEALAVGVPAISTDISGIPELIQPGRTGLLVPPGSPEDLAAAIRNVIEQPHAALARAEQGRALVESEFDIARTGTEMAHLLFPPGAAHTGAAVG